MRNGALLRRQILLSTAIAGASLFNYGYMRRAYGACVDNGGGSFTCSGTSNTGATIAVGGANANITIDPDTDFNVPAGSALSIITTGEVTVSDTNSPGHESSFVSGTGTALGIHKPGGNSALTIHSYLNFSGANAISAVNDGTGLIDIDTFGQIYSTAPASKAIFTTGYGSQLSVDTHGTVSGGEYGIFAKLFDGGAGTLSITTEDSVVGRSAGSYGIFAKNYGAHLSITTSGEVSGGARGIFAYQSSTSTGNAYIDAQGNVTATDTDGIGIYTYNGNAGVGNLTIASSGNVAGGMTAGSGIWAKNKTGALSINTSGDVSGYRGIIVDNYSNASTTITTNGGEFTGTIGMFIRSRNDASHITVQNETEINTNFGITAHHYGNDALSIILNNSSITASTGQGLFINNTMAAATVFVENGASISGNTFGIREAAANTLNVVLDGTTSGVSVTGTNNEAILFNSGDDSLTLKGTVALDGDVNGGTGTNTLNLQNTTTTLTSGSKISGFSVLNVTGGASTINGDLDSTGLSLNNLGNLHINGNITAGTFTVGNNGEFGGNNTLTGNLVVGNGGTVAPGNSIGTINVTGNVVFNTGSIFDVELAGATSDRLNATGSITIDSGATLNLIPLANVTGSSFTFLQAGTTLTGTFDTVNYNGLAASVVYNPASAGLNFSVLTASPLAVNSQALSTLSTSTLFADTVSDHTTDNAFGNEKHIWGKAIYSGNNYHTNGLYTGFNSNVYGAVFGAENPVSDSWKLGFSLAELVTNTNVDFSLGSSNGAGTFASVYTSYVQTVQDGWDMFVTGGLTSGYHNVDTKRLVSNSGVTSNATADINSYEAGMITAIGGRKAIGDNGWMVSPKISLGYTHIFGQGYTEQTGGAAAVTINDYDFGMLRPKAELSFYNHEGFTLSGSHIVAKPNINIGAFKEYATNDRNVAGTFSAGTPFNLKLDENSRAFATAGLGADFDITPGVTAFISYQGAANHDELRNEAKIGAELAF